MQSRLFAKLKQHFRPRVRSALGVIGTCAAFVSLTLLLNSCSSLNGTVLSPLQIPGAMFAGNQACFECHTNYVRVFPSSPHARIHFAAANAVGQSGCESCHGPGSRHIAAGGGRGVFIINPGRKPEACFRCHFETHAEFKLPQHHPVIEGHMNCVQCHDPHGADIFKPAGGLAMARQNETCAQCHREQARPVLFEHEAMREGCTVCHSPHGSINAKMLVQRDNNLCLKCHAQSPGPGAMPGRIFIGNADHTGLLRMGTCTTSGCHTAVHGSNVSRSLLY